MRHVYHCPVRWADLDLLGHVNNVVYVDYLQEARVDFMRALLPPRAADMTEGVVVVSHEVTYVATMAFRFRAVQVECWVTEVRAATFTLAYEVFDEDDEGVRTTYLRATTVLTPYVFADERPRRLTTDEKDALRGYLEPAEPRVPAPRPARLDVDGAFRWPLHVRFSDVDAYRHVNNVKYFEYLQESRIRLIADVMRGLDVARPGLVVAQTDVDYLAPILLREAPYDVRSRIARVGSRSMTVDSEITDGDRLLARGRVVVVFFDLETQRSTEPAPEVRAQLLARADSA